MLDFAGFSDYSKVLCLQSIFSNRLILSHICPRKFGKYVMFLIAVNIGEHGVNIGEHGVNGSYPLLAPQLQISK